MAQSVHRFLQIDRKPRRVGSFEHVSGFIVSACERDVDEASHDSDAGRVCDEFVNHVGTLPNPFQSATNAKTHCSVAQPERAFI